MNESLERTVKCIGMLDQDQIWHRFGSETPSVGNLVLHLTGNVRQWILSTFTEMGDERQRDAEFASLQADREKLVQDFESVIERAIEVIKGLDKGELTASYSVQGFEESGTDIVVHVVEHLSYHTGQIALHTKILTNRDLGFYAGQDLNSTGPTVH